MRIPLIAAAVVLAGCQTVQTADQLRALAWKQTDFTICDSLVNGHPAMRQVSAEEMQRRKLDCTPHMAAIQARQQANANQAALGLQMLQMSRPQPVMVAPPPMMQPPVRCTSRNVMGTVYTDCN